MGEEKRNRIIAAVTVNVVILIFIIIAVIISQIVEICGKKAYLNDLTEQCNQLEQQVEEREDFLERYQADEEYHLLLDEIARLQSSR